jgi:polysaccharide export outer membrane protein
MENVDLQLARLMRNGKQVEADFYTLFEKGDISQDVQLQSEDILYLPTNEKNKIYVVGAVNQPQIIIYREGLRILDAILQCGGFSKFAKESAVLVLRRDGEQEKRIKINVEDLINEGDLSQNIALARGDYVMVQEGFF